MKDTGGPAFPYTDYLRIHSEAMAATDGLKTEKEAEKAYIEARKEAMGGMTLRQYAAIHLKVPDSGTDWLDEMIRKSLRDDIAAKALANTYTQDDANRPDKVAKWAYEVADAMLKERGQ